MDLSDHQAALETLRAVDHDHLLNVVNETSRKQYKEHRGRSKGKISFRNFAKGGLALSLPTKNSESKPWAIFNGACQQQTRLMTENLLSWFQSLSHTTFLTPRDI